ncbi:sigma-54-dependent Fis family transcriptional regulator [Halioxenophilus sp. WMMB6]|uniref:sigma-54-dependent Fis family transcriptional regulator n=1 Tax=Halioxenophilus sp. WMMB6 TaxID=3073815 RepID=UPI00295F4746|nr:sigma-54-dependent Fis family transcriptional regulator [Halioxenophilus sp. WMMB6]
MLTKMRLIDHFNLRSSLRFDIDRGHIWLGQNRMFLLHTAAFGELRRSIIDNFGIESAKALFLRMGFISGQQDSALAYKMYEEGDNFDVFKLGPELHAFEGLTKAEVTEADIDWEQGIFYGRAKCQHSAEAEQHVRHYGIGDEVACWAMAGYASGYTTGFFKRFIVFKEIECACKGDEVCIIEGRPAEAWDDQNYVDLFRSERVTRDLADLENELKHLRGKRAEVPTQGNLVGESHGFKQCFDILSRAAKAPISVLILGETGVGKEVFARWLHDNSDRNNEPFVAINCGAIPSELIEAELFGVSRGAFTGAQESRPGKFERADGGTLFLDELGELSLAAQVKLLRVLQTGEIERLGDNKIRTVNVRLVAATNVDLNKLIDEGKFRSDLYYRLSAYPVEIPPLRERASDIKLLIKAMIEKYAPVYDKKVCGVTDEAIAELTQYDWPGNVRQLENVIERAILLLPENGWIGIEQLKIQSARKMLANVKTDGAVSEDHFESVEVRYDQLPDDQLNLKQHEDKLLKIALKRANGNVSEAARLLGLSRRQVAYKMSKLDT